MENNLDLNLLKALNLLKDLKILSDRLIEKGVTQIKTDLLITIKVKTLDERKVPRTTIRTTIRATIRVV